MSSGPNIPESQRNTEQLKLRLAPEVVEALDELRGEQGRSRWVAERIRRAARRLGILRPATRQLQEESLEGSEVKP